VIRLTNPLRRVFYYPAMTFATPSSARSPFLPRCLARLNTTTVCRVVTRMLMMEIAAPDDKKML